MRGDNSLRILTRIMDGMILTKPSFYKTEKLTSRFPLIVVRFFSIE